MLVLFGKLKWNVSKQNFEIRSMSQEKEVILAYMYVLRLGLRLAFMRSCQIIHFQMSICNGNSFRLKYRNNLTSGTLKSWKRAAAYISAINSLKGPITASHIQVGPLCFRVGLLNKQNEPNNNSFDLWIKSEQPKTNCVRNQLWI